MDHAFEVRVAGKGWIKGRELVQDDRLIARCSVCGNDADLVVAMTPEVFACRSCLRARLDAASVATYRFTESGPHTGLPWGKIAG
ncbi:MAG: hypothetical protein HY904_02775 [Deltaproteobacteria bacterium]|nr:hypothetical protein [Deltaproteobacteria bacterium]